MVTRYTPFTARINALNPVPRTNSILDSARNAQSEDLISTFLEQFTGPKEPLFKAPTTSGSDAFNLLADSDPLRPLAEPIFGDRGEDGLRQPAPTLQFPFTSENQSPIGEPESSSGYDFLVNAYQSMQRSREAAQDFITDSIDTQFDITNQRIADAAAAFASANEDLGRNYRRAFDDIALEMIHLQENAALELGRLRDLQNQAREVAGQESGFLRDAITRAEEQFELAMGELNTQFDRINGEMVDAINLGSNVLASQGAFTEAVEERNATVGGALREAKAAAKAVSSARTAAVAEQGQAAVDMAFAAAEKGGDSPEAVALNAIVNEQRGLKTDAVAGVSQTALELLGASRALAASQAEENIRSDALNSELQRVMTEADFAIQNESIATAIEQIQFALEDTEAAKTQAMLDMEQFKETVNEQQARLNLELGHRLRDLAFDESAVGMALRHAMEKLGIDQNRLNEDFEGALADLQAEFGFDTGSSADFGLEVALSQMESLFGEDVDPFLLDNAFGNFVTLFLENGIVTREALQQERDAATLADSEDPGSNPFTEDEWNMFLSTMDAYEQSISAWNQTFGTGATAQSWVDTLPPGSNGNIPLNQLTPIGRGHYLAPTAANSWLSMVNAAAADGINIGLTDSYRDYATQVRLAQEKGLYSQGGLAATPGTSLHGLGIAVDVVLNSGVESWLNANAHRWGFETIPREPWHWQWTGGGNVNANGTQTVFGFPVTGGSLDDDHTHTHNVAPTSPTGAAVINSPVIS